MAYPPRPQLQVLPRFAGTNRPGVYASTDVRDFVVDQYTNHGRSLREIAELTGRSFSAIRSILNVAGQRRRPAGAPSCTTERDVDVDQPTPARALSLLAERHD